MKFWTFLLLLLFLAVSCRNAVKDELLSEVSPELPHDGQVYQAFEISDSLLLGLPSQSENMNPAFQKARAYYMKALEEELETEQHVSAYEDYLKSLWIMDGLTGKRHVFTIDKQNADYEHLTALIYDRLAWFLYTNDVWNISLECLEESNACFMKEENLLGVASNLELMGDVMLAQADKEGAMIYYKRADSIHERLNTDDIYQHFSSLIHRAQDLYNVGEKHASYDLLHHALEMTDNERLKRQVRFSLGYFYFENQQFDSALINLEQGYPLLPRQTLKTYCRIIKASNILGDSLKSAYYGELLSDMYLNRVAQSGDRSKMVMLYEKYKADSKDAKQKDVFYFILLVVTILVIIILVDIFLIERRKRRHKKEIEAREKIQATLENEIVTTKNDSKRKEEKIKSLESKLEKVVSNPDFQKLPFDQKMETLYEMLICKRVRRVLDANVKASISYPELVLSEPQLTMLVNAVDAVFPNFSVRIIERFPRMKRSDVVYCCMYILGVTEVQAAALTGKTYQAVWTRSMKLHEIFDNKSNLQLVLHGFLKDWKSSTY